MITPRAIIEMLSRTVEAIQLDDGVRVSTHVLYPSNGAVSVVVRGGEDEFIVSDEGGAIAEMIGSGLKAEVSDSTIRTRIKYYGLGVSAGSIVSPAIPIDAIPAAIMLVANASKEVADWALKNLRFRTPRNFREDLAALLGRYFHDNLKRDAPIIGASAKLHKFVHVVYLSGDRKLLIDPVVSEASSVNARLVANLDVKLAHNPLLDQLIIYDDSLSWQSSDLKLLEMGARTVAFSRAEPEIAKRAV
ncbi:MAG: hypothetical protein HYR63_11170 [Proteobacteria bacterium]|nr:hypothetical protein [Pseudomonadota bacterium]MBI3498217.1 hypothetical protein [Pseudomonadota bacterium]